MVSLAGRSPGALATRVSVRGRFAGRRMAKATETRAYPAQARADAGAKQT